MGNNLLGDMENMVFEYKGEKYGVDTLYWFTRTCVGEFYGLLKLVSDDGRDFLSFGQFDGDRNVTDEEVIIHWGDGTTDMVQFSNTCKIKGAKIDIKRVVKFNGVVVDNSILMSSTWGRGFCVVK